MSENKEEERKSIALSIDTNALPSKGKSWFIGIGIDKYQNYRNLNNAVKDVQNILTLLQERYDFTTNNIHTIFNEQATRENIISELDKLVDVVEPQDKVLIYYSGHGHLNIKTSRGYWVPQNAVKENTAFLISNTTIKNYLEDINSRHTLLISDSCFSGSLLRRGVNRSNSALEELEQLTSRWVLCSGRHDEEVFDGEPGDNSPFAKSLMEILRNNQDQRLNIAQISDQVIKQTRSQYKQLPEGNPLKIPGDNGGQYVFHLKDEYVIAKSQRNNEAFPATMPRKDFKASKFLEKIEVKNLQTPKSESLRIRDFLNSFYDDLTTFKIKFEVINQIEIGKKIYENILQYTVLRDKFILFFEKIIERESVLDYDRLISFFERASSLRSPERGRGSWFTYEYDNFRFIIHELFLYLVALGLKYEHFSFIDQLLNSSYYLKGLDGYQSESERFDKFYCNLQIIDEFYCHKIGRKIVNPTGDLMVNRVPKNVDYDIFIQADLLCYHVADLNNLNWFPHTYLYKKDGNYLFYFKMSSKRHFEKVKAILGVTSVMELKERLETLRENDIKSSRKRALNLKAIYHLIDVGKIATER